MQKWQKENKEQRSVLCIRTSEENIIGIHQGASLPIVIALMQLADSDSDWKNLISVANTKHPIAKMLLFGKWEEFKKEHGIKNADGNEDKAPEEDPETKSFLKDLFKTIADKL